MRTIYKYKLDVVERQTIDMPETAKILKVAVQGDDICLWAQVNTNYLKGKRSFAVVGTGSEISDSIRSHKYIDSVQMMKGVFEFVWHVYEIK